MAKSCLWFSVGFFFQLFVHIKENAEAILVVGPKHYAVCSSVIAGFPQAALADEPRARDTAGESTFCPAAVTSSSVPNLCVSSSLVSRKKSLSALFSLILRTIFSS